jgi:tetratricopeptide (TPR) repeat protein
MQKAKAAAARALALDPNLPEAHISMGFIKHFFDWDYEGGDADFERAIALAPNNAHAHALYGKLLGDTFQWDKSLVELERALELEPYSVTTIRDLGETLYFMRRYEEAIDVFERSFEIEPVYAGAYLWIARCHEALGRREEAVKAHLRRLAVASSSTGSGVTAPTLAEMEHAFVTGGWDGFWRAELARLTALRATAHVEPFRFVETHVRLGQVDEAFEWLETAYAERSMWFPIVASEPLLEPLTTDPRYERILRLANHERYWRPSE